MTAEQINDAISKEQAIGAWTESQTQRVLIKPTAVDTEEPEGIWVYGYRLKGPRVGRRITGYPRRYFVSRF